MPATPFTVARPVKVARSPVTVKVSMLVDSTVLSVPWSRKVRWPLGAASPLANWTSKPKLARPPAEVPRRIDISASSPATCPPPVARPGVLATISDNWAATGTAPSIANSTSSAPEEAAASRAGAVAGRTNRKRAPCIAARHESGQSRPRAIALEGDIQLGDW